MAGGQLCGLNQRGPEAGLKGVMTSSRGVQCGCCGPDVEGERGQRWGDG